MAEVADEYEEVTSEQSVRLMRVAPPGPPTWQPSYAMNVPEELQPGMVLEVSVSSIVNVIAHLFRKEPSGAVREPVLSPAPASKLRFVYPVDVAGSYQLRLSQCQLYSLVEAKVKMTIKIPKPKEDPGSSGQ